MVIDILALLKQELLLSVIIIVLLIIKIGADEWKTSNLLNVINLLLLINFSAGFVLNLEGSLFNGMFNTNRLIILEKNILNLATLIISFQSFNWLKEHNPATTNTVEMNGIAFSKPPSCSTIRVRVRK